ncbi:MAG TPA: SRPBCC family protein [Acidimicrobiales bacterium]|nr:SRPBCC family protein [Acidimicrobiales bacterium]
MSTVEVSAERAVRAPAERVYGYLADYSEHHHHFLPPAFSGFRVVAGGVGAGTEVEFSVTAGGRSRPYHMAVSEPEPGRVLVETDANSSLVTTFTVTPAGDTCRVRMHTAWKGAGGIGGIFERLFAPKVMKALYEDELQRLDAYAASAGGA